MPDGITDAVAVPSGAATEVYPGIYETPGVEFDQPREPGQPQPAKSKASEPAPEAAQQALTQGLGLDTTTEGAADAAEPVEPSTPATDAPDASAGEDEFAPIILDRGGIEGTFEIDTPEKLAEIVADHEQKKSWQRSYSQRDRALADTKKQFEQVAQIGSLVYQLPDEYKTLIEEGLKGRDLRTALGVLQVVNGTASVPPQYIDDGYGQQVENPEYLRFMVQRQNVEIERLRNGVSNGASRGGQNPSLQTPQKQWQPQVNAEEPPEGTVYRATLDANKANYAEAMDAIAAEFGAGKDDTKAREQANDAILAQMELDGLDGVNKVITPKEYREILIRARPALKERAAKNAQSRAENANRTKPRSNEGPRAASGVPRQTVGSDFNPAMAVGKRPLNTY